jgi:hypothetical protein
MLVLLLLAVVIVSLIECVLVIDGTIAFEFYLLSFRKCENYS